MTTAAGVAVIATQVARTDRRALSEAWYSALHLAHAGAPPPANRAPRAATAFVPGAERLPSHDAHDARATPLAALRAPRREHAAAAGASAGERRRPACATARRIERAVTRLATRPNGAAAQTVDVDGGRVRLLVRAERGATRIVAVCSPRLREPVERALANASFALAGSGFAVAH